MTDNTAMPKNPLRVLIFIVVMVLIVGGFYWQVFRSSPADALPPGVRQHFRVFLDRKPCVDGCPTYAVLAKGSGTVDYAGGKHVATKGSASAELTGSQLAALYRAIRKAEFFSIPDIYHREPGGAGCTAQISGQPRVVIGVSEGRKTKVIHYSYGCRGAPQALRVLAADIDKILNTKRWTGTAPTPETEPS